MKVYSIRCTVRIIVEERKSFNEIAANFKVSSITLSHSLLEYFVYYRDDHGPIAS